MAGKQNFGGHFHSESSQYNGSNFYVTTFLNIADSKSKDDLLAPHSNLRKDLTESDRDGDDKRFELGLDENISWDG